MKEFAVRLIENDDLKFKIEELCKINNINTAIILSAVGSIKHINIRLAKAINTLDLDNDYEIISLNGTISKGEAHIHIAVSDDKGVCLGGHLKEGTIINTTCELVIGVLEEYDSYRDFDSNTKFDEIHFIKK